MFVAAMLLLLIVTASAEAADDGVAGPARWLRERGEAAKIELLTVSPAADPLSLFIEHCKRSAIGVRPIFTLLPNDAADTRQAEPPTIAFFARAKGRTLISLTRVKARADDGQDVLLQRTVVSDLLAGRRFSLTVYEDHTIGAAAARLMGVGTRLTFRPPGWPFRVDVLGSYDVDSGASAYLGITAIFAAPPVPATMPR